MAPDAAEQSSQLLLDHLTALAPVLRAQQGIPIERYHRSATLLLRQVEQYRTSRDLESYYVYLLRYLQLVVETIPEHRQHAGGTSSAYRGLRKEANRLMPELERIQKELKAVRWVPAGEKKEGKEGRGAGRVQAGHVPGVTWRDELGGQSSATATATATASGPVSVSVSVSESVSAAKSASVSDAMKVIVGSIDGVGVGPSGRTKSQFLASHPLESHTNNANKLYPDPRVGMRLGPQEVGVTSLVPASSSLRDHQGQHHRNHHAQDQSCCTPALLDTAPHAGKVTQTIRNVHISAGLMNEFLRYAASNTRASIETCGILAGRLMDMDGSGQLSTFVISHLIVPKQQGTSDTVQALAEEEIYEAQDSRALYPLGWIHTHPTQSCFLSSVDVHTQCGYQTMLDEAIAVVMAPTDQTSPVGIFRLSTPGGLKAIQRCSARGFHPHGPTETGQPLYELCNHVYLDEGVGYEVLDLRTTTATAPN